MNTQPQSFTWSASPPLPGHHRPVHALITQQSMDVGTDALRLLESGDFTAARARIKTLRFTHATAPEGYLMFIMVTYAKQGNARMALRYARQVLLANPGSAPALNTAAEMLARLGSLDEAAALARQLLEAHPRESGAWTTLAVVAARRGNREEAVAHARQALTVRPDNRLATLMLATLLFGLDRHSEAIPVLRRLVRRSPADYEARFMLGSALHATSNYAGAIRSLRRTLSAGDLDTETRVAALSHIVSAYLCLGNLKRYGEYVVQLASRYGYDPEVQEFVAALEAEAAEARRAAADPTVRRLDANYKTLLRSRRFVDELHALNSELQQVWDEVVAVVRQIRARPMNKKVSTALAAIQPNLHAAAELEKESARRFDQLETLVSSASDSSSAFSPASLREHLGDLQQSLLSALDLVRTGLSSAQAVFKAQTLQLGH